MQNCRIISVYLDFEMSGKIFVGQAEKKMVKAKVQLKYQ